MVNAVAGRRLKQNLRLFDQTQQVRATPSLRLSNHAENAGATPALVSDAMRLSTLDEVE